MLVAKYYNNNDIRLEGMPLPKIGPGEILIKVRASGICGTDVMEWYRIQKAPRILGHEIAGEIEWTGSQETTLAAGDRVALHYNISCGDCYYCSTGNEQFCTTVKMLGHHVDGGYAEYVAVPARNAIPLPEEIPFEEGATLMSASATALHGLRKSRVRAGETVAVFGVGGLGLSAIQLARAMV